MTEPIDDPQDPGRLRYSMGPTAADDEAQERAEAWARRFGSRLPEKLSSGNWRYRDTDVARLRLVSELVAHGADPRALMDLSLGDLEQRSDLATYGLGRSSDYSELDTEQAIRFIKAYDADGLLDQLLEIGSTREACTFIEQDLAPLLVEIGQRRSVGALDIPQENLASETIQSLLHQLKARTQRSSESKHLDCRVTVVLAGLSGERHELPLQMVAYVAELAGARSVVVGTDVTAEFVAHSTELAQADIVGIHSSAGSSRERTHALLAELREQLPEFVTLIVGGAGGARAPAGVVSMDSLSEFESFIGDRVNR